MSLRLGAITLWLLMSLAFAGCATSTVVDNRPTATPAPSEALCPATVVDTVAALTKVDALEQGKDFQVLADAVAAAQKAYKLIKPPELSQSCLFTVGQPTEKALNGYLDAFGRWAACGVECDPATVTGFSDAWLEASIELGAAKGALDLGK